MSDTSFGLMSLTKNFATTIGSTQIRAQTHTRYLIEPQSRVERHHVEVHLAQGDGFLSHDDLAHLHTHTDSSAETRTNASAPCSLLRTDMRSSYLCCLRSNMVQFFDMCQRATCAPDPNALQRPPVHGRTFLPRSSTRMPSRARAHTHALRYLCYEWHVRKHGVYVTLK